MRVLNDSIFTVATATVGTLTSEAFELTHMGGFCAQFVFTQTAGALAGTLQLQASNDGLTWSNPQAAATISGTTSVFNNIADVYYDQIRYVLVLSGGTCDVFAELNAKGF